MNKRGAIVYMLCRNVERGNEAVRQLFVQHGCDQARMHVRELDLCSFASIRRFVADFVNGESKTIE